MNIFVNEQERRPRAGWRLLLQLILFFIFMLMMLFASRVMIIQQLKLYQVLAMGIAGFASVWVAAIVIDKRPLKDFGTGWNTAWKKELALGLVFGSLAMGVIFLLQWSMGWLYITGFGWERSFSMPYAIWLGTYLLAMVIVGFYEELIFRGYQILNLFEGLRRPGQNPLHTCFYAIAVSSIIFGLVHAGNANASWVSTLNIIIAGAVLAMPYIYTGRLGLSVGLHISWNFVQGGIFGFAVSGMPFRGSLLQTQNRGAEILTGGAFGPEAGLVGLLGFGIILFLTFAYLTYSGQWGTLHPLFSQAKTNFNKTDEQGA